MSILECKALTKSYGAREALKSVDLTIEPGHIVGLLGPNGSGKTTLIKLCNGLLTPSSGELLIDGKKPSRATKAIVSYLPDRDTLALTARRRSRHFPRACARRRSSSSR